MYCIHKGTYYNFILSIKYLIRLTGGRQKQKNIFSLWFFRFPIVLLRRVDGLRFDRVCYAVAGATSAFMS